MGAGRHWPVRHIVCAALFLAAVMLSACGVSGGYSSGPPATDLAGNWDYAATSTAVSLVVQQDGHFTGVVKYGPSLQYAGDLSGQFAAGSLFSGGAIRPRQGSPDPGFNLAASVGTSSITVWRSNAPDAKLELTRP